MRFFLFSAFFLVAQVNAAAPISDHALTNYTKDGYRKTFERWGDAGVERIKKLERLAVSKAAESPSCDSVDYAGLSDQRSSPPNNIVVFVDCKNSQRFYLSEDDIGSDAVTQSSKAVTESNAGELCRELVLQNSKFPSSVNFSALNSSAFSNKTTGNTVSQLEFEAKNGLGAVLPYKARCVFTEVGAPEIEITER
ncbi:hypothetical protein BI292_06210 [Pseudomonas sp. 43NM1]|uniref:hypothetical protein n=1 Tax=Pseudomonas sp. 43NM1 TaxID=1904755 RepID=UPI000C3457C4|nr:hypothetical protein [Pseudomonas sp. 43NM1]PKH12600.1 hypothetical protein BI292_06210 [Pseudomonas sp. 43NM1]